MTYKIPTPSAITIDANGDAYVGTYSSTAGYITELLPQGGVNATSTTSVPNLYGLGVSTASAVWATSNSNSKLYQFTGALAANGSFSSAVTVSPTALAIDSSGNVYVVNNSGNNSLYYYISEFNSAGTVTHYAPSYEFANANSLAMASNGSLWTTATNSNAGIYPNPSTNTNNPSTYLATGIGGTPNDDAVAVDYQGNAWIAAKNGTGNQTLVRVPAAAPALSTSFGINTNNNFAIGGMNNAVAVAVDGSNTNNGNYFNIWVANAGNSTVSEVSSSATTSTLSPSVGYQVGTGPMSSLSAIAVDNAGNVWVTNQGTSTVTEIIGSATPVTTPLAAMAPGVAP